MVTAYHLYQDWIKKAGTEEQKLRLKNLPLKGKLLFEVLRDITNASKHWRLDDFGQKRQVVKNITGPIVGDWDSFLFTGPVFYVRVGETLPSLPDLAGATISCFTWVLEDGVTSQLISLEQTLEMVFRPLSESQEQELINDVNGRSVTNRKGCLR